MAVNEGSFGRDATRCAKHPNGMFKFNRMNLSYQEMFMRRRRDGDLFAVFQNEMGEIRVEYARTEDYEEFAFEQIERSARFARHGLTEEDVFLLIGCTMISRIHELDFENFIHLLDHNLAEVFDMRRLVEWTNINMAFFGSPAGDAVLADAEDQASLTAEYDLMANGGGR